jgi:hypothetical protein
MPRRRTILKWATLLFVCAAGILLFFRGVVSQDPDIQWLGPRSKGIREWLARLETPVDIGGAKKSMSLADALSLLYERCDAVQVELPVVVDWLAFKRDGLQGEPYHMQIDLSTIPQRLSAKQFLKAVIAQFPSKNARILLRSPMGDLGGYIEITTHNQADVSRAAYERAYGVTRLDYLWQGFCEAIGSQGHLPEAGITFP